jgi:GNAT superfamily N-acetyltransferase
MIPISSIRLPLAGLDLLLSEAQSEGYDFVQTLVEDWASGANRWDGPGETLCGHLDQGLVVAVGGLNCDPFAGDPRVGRIRRVFIRREWRNRGIGRALVSALVDHARAHFHTVRLRAENRDAARLYERMGFVPITDPDATHTMVLTPSDERG